MTEWLGAIIAYGCLALMLAGTASTLFRWMT